MRAFLGDTVTEMGQSAADVAAQTLNDGDTRLFGVADGSPVAWDEVVHDATRRAYVILTPDQTAIQVVALTGFDCKDLFDPSCKFRMTAYYDASGTVSDAIRARLQLEIDGIVEPFGQTIGPGGMSQGAIPSHMSTEIRWVPVY